MYRSPGVNYGFMAFTKGVSVNIAFTSQFQLLAEGWPHKKGGYKSPLSYFLIPRIEPILLSLKTAE